MKKRLLAAVMAFVLAFSFTACGDSQTQTAPDGQQASVQHRVYGEKIIDYIMDGEGIEPVCEYGYTKISSDEMSSIFSGSAISSSAISASTVAVSLHMLILRRCIITTFLWTM